MHESCVFVNLSTTLKCEDTPRQRPPERELNACKNIDLLPEAAHHSSTTLVGSIQPQQFCSGSTTSQAKSLRHWSPCRVAGDSSKHQRTAEENSGPASSFTSSAHFFATIKRSIGLSVDFAPNCCQSSCSSSCEPNSSSSIMMPKHAKLLSVAFGVRSAEGSSGSKFADTKGRSRRTSVAFAPTCGNRTSPDSQCLLAHEVE